jgi:hypothetical protein
MLVPRAEVIKLLDVGYECLPLFAVSGRRGLHFDHRFHVIWFDGRPDVGRPFGMARKPRFRIRAKHDDVALLLAADPQFKVNATGLKVLCVPVQRALGNDL